MILLDEPAGGLDTTESQWLGDRLRAVRDSGTTIVIIDHDMSLVLDLCDQICVLDFGRIIAQGPPELVRSVAPLRSGQPVAANRQGLIHTPDDRALFTTLSVRENLTLARRKGGPDLDDTVELFPALAKRWTLAAGSLSGGEQQMLAVARGLVQKPKVLLIDEMSMGLAPVIVESLLPVVRRIADDTDAA